MALTHLKMILKKNVYVRVLTAVLGGAWTLGVQQYPEALMDCRVKMCNRPELESSSKIHRVHICPMHVVGWSV